MNALELAILFHDAYEELAPEYGYETRPETREFNAASPNGMLMVAVADRVLATMGRRMITKML